jgi:hypothetical protein
MTGPEALGRTAPGVVPRAARGVALLVLLASTACADHGSDIAVVYRGDVAAYRSLVHVRLDSGERARVVTPTFPSATHPAPIATRGELPLLVALVAASGDTLARYSAPPIRLAPKTAYRIGVVVGQRPPASRCNGAWAGAAIAPGSGARAGSESLYVSVTTWDRTREQPRCDD